MAQIIGTDGSDTLRGTEQADLIDGRGGNDYIQALAGSDFVIGGEGNDGIMGGAVWTDDQGGNDILMGGPGNDFLVGGSIFMAAGGTGSLPNSGNDILDGGPGNDSLYGFDGNDYLIGGPGNDLLDAGLPYGYTSGGTSGVSNAGDDIMIGGPGADQFGFRNESDHDLVLDFSRGNGDKIELSYRFTVDGQRDLVNDFAELGARIDQGLITVATSDCALSMSFAGNDVLKIYGIQSLDANDWIFVA